MRHSFATYHAVKYRRRGKLPGKKLLSGVLVIKRETVIKAFRIVHDDEAKARK